MPLKVAIVGIGNIGTRHSQVYTKNPKAELVAVCDIDREKADRRAGELGVRAFYSVKELLTSGIHIDACSMCTKGEENGGDHYEPTMELLEAGMPVLGEKPISNDVEKAREMVALARVKKVPYGINLNHRFTPAAKRAREWLDKGRLGMPHMVNMRMWINNPSESSPWFHLRALHPHSFDVLRYFCGDVKKVCCFCMKGEGRKIWSNAQILLEFKGGMIGSLAGSYDATGPSGSFGLEHVDLSGSKGRFLLEEACQRLSYYPRQSMEIETYHYLGGMLHFNETFDSRIGDWLDQIEARTPYDRINGSGEDALRAQLIIEGAIESWETGAIVELHDPELT
jgi:predicted dehydrogenase